MTLSFCIRGGDTENRAVSRAEQLEQLDREGGDGDIDTIAGEGPVNGGKHVVLSLS